MSARRLHVAAKSLVKRGAASGHSVRRMKVSPDLAVNIACDAFTAIKTCQGYFEVQEVDGVETGTMSASDRTECEAKVAAVITGNIPGTAGIINDNTNKKVIETFDLTAGIRASSGLDDPISNGRGQWQCNLGVK